MQPGLRPQRAPVRPPVRLWLPRPHGRLLPGELPGLGLSQCCSRKALVRVLKSLPSSWAGDRRLGVGGGVGGGLRSNSPFSFFNSSTFHQSQPSRTRDPQFSPLPSPPPITSLSHFPCFSSSEGPGVSVSHPQSLLRRVSFSAATWTPAEPSSQRQCLRLALVRETSLFLLCKA